VFTACIYIKYIEFIKRRKNNLFEIQCAHFLMRNLLERQTQLKAIIANVNLKKLFAIQISSTHLPQYKA
jgi:hypothetical protein